jgi:hypothetical protein
MIDDENWDAITHSFDTVIQLESSLLQKLGRTHEKNGPAVRFSSFNVDDKQYLVMHTPGEEADARTVIPCEVSESDTLKIGDDEIPVQRKSAAKTDMFSLRTLNLMTKATSMSTFVELYLAEDYPPMIVRYRVGSLGHLSFMIAPKEEEAVDIEAIREDIKLDEARIRGMNDIQKTESTVKRRKRKSDDDDHVKAANKKAKQVESEEERESSGNDSTEE